MLKVSTAGRIRRLVGASALAFLVVAGPVAGNASAAELDSFSGMGTGFALRVTVDLSGLPDQAKSLIQDAYEPLASASGGALPAQFPFVIDQKFIESLADLGKNSTARALLGQGFRDFDSVAEVTSTGEKTVVTASEKLPSAELPVLDVSVGELVASITDEPRVSGDASLARVSATLAAVGELMPAELQALFDDVVDAVNGAIATANTTLDTELGEVATTLTETTDPIVGGLLDQAGLGAVADDPAALTAELQNVVSIPSIDDLLAGDIASVSGLESETSSAKTKDGKVVSDATSKIFAANVLGLVSTGIVNLSSHSEAAGVKGSADNSSECSIADVNVGGANGVSLDGDTLNVNGTAIPVPAVEVGAVKDVVDGVLAQAGISVELCDAAEEDVDADGTSAAQRVSAFRIVVAPRAPVAVDALGISAGDELVRIVIDPTVETAAAAQVALAAPPAAKPSLPKTGAATVVTILSGIGLAGGALLARKRFS